MNMENWRFKFLRFHDFSYVHGQDISNFKQFIVSAFIWYKFHSKFLKTLKISLSRALKLRWRLLHAFDWNRMFFVETRY